MSESQHTAPPGGTPQLDDPTTAPAADALVALNGHAEPTDDTPTIISRTSSRSIQEEPSGGLRGRHLAHFELIEPIGVGGMAAVIRARDTQLDRLVALKILPPDMAVDPENVRRFHQEARSAARLDHENIARVFFCGEDQRLHFIAFEFVEGDNLRTILERRGRLPVAEALHYILQVAAGLAHAAQRGVVHRDIKPSNIIITPTGRAKLVDMGLARSMERQDDQGLTQSGVTLGTFDYISPEQALEPREADVRSDIYSLGCTLYHVLTGQPPVPEGTAAKKLHHHQHVKPRDPRQLVPGLPDDAAVILDRMMAKRPQDRYQAPEQLVHHLLLAARKLGSAGPNVPEGVLSVEAALPPPPGGRPLLLAGMAAVLVVVLVVLLELFNRTPAAAPLVDPVRPDKQTVVNPPANPNPDPAPPSTEVRDKPPAPKDKGAVDPTPVVAAVKYDDQIDTIPLGEWLKSFPDAPKDILLSHDLDLSMRDGQEIGLALSGPRVTIRAKASASRPTIRFANLDARPQGTEAWAAVTIDSPSVLVQGVRFLVDGRTSNVHMIGLRLRGGQGSGAAFTVDNCEFIQAQPGVGEKRLVSVEAAGAAGAATELKLTACRFLSFQKLEGDALKYGQFAGGDAVVRDGAVRITASDCAFGPHAVDFRLQGGRDVGPTLTLDHCSILAAAPTTVVDVQPAGAADLNFHACLFSRPDGPAGSPAEGAVLIRQADPTGVRCQDDDSRYSGLDAYWMVGDSGPSAWADYLTHALTVAKPSLMVGFPWNSDDPLQAFRQYNFQEASADKHFVDAFQVNETRPDLRAAGSRPSVPVGVRSLGGVNYGDVIAEADQQADLKLSKQRFVDPLSGGDDGRKTHVYATLEEALAASKPGDEIVIRFDGLLPVAPIRLDKQNLQDVTIRPEVGRHPVLRLIRGADSDSEPALFRVNDGALKLDGLEFSLEPSDKFSRQTLVDLAGQGQCVLTNCLITLDGHLQPRTRLAVATLSDPGKAMMPSAGPAGAAPQLRLDGCFVRGDGDLIACQTSRPLDFTAINTLAALKGSFLNVEVAADAPTAPTGQMTLTLERVTTYLGGNLIHLRPGKDSRSLTAVSCAPSHCLFVAAARDPQALIHLDNSDAEEKAVQKLVTWTPGAGPIVYGNYAAMLDQSPPGDAMPQMMAVNLDKWESSWDNGAGTLQKPFKFRGANPPPDSGSFAGVAPPQFRQPSAVGDCGADVGRLQVLVHPAGPADVSPKGSTEE